ncbi:hypothetical protein NNT41_004119 [Raoultella planticola]|nr:hypothetical protein [Raoultella planticola]
MDALIMKRMMVAVMLFLTSSIALGAGIEQPVSSGVRAYMAAKCISYAEIAGMVDSDPATYNKLTQTFTDNVAVYIENAQHGDFKTQALETTIPITWFGMVNGSRIDSKILAGRLLEWTNMVETQRVADTFAPGEGVVPESAGVAAFNNDNCILLVK